MAKKVNIESLSERQRTIRYALCVDVECFLDEHEGATQEEFLKAFNEDSDWNEGYKDWAKEAKENIETVLKEEIFPKYCKKGSNVLRFPNN